MATGCYTSSGIGKKFMKTKLFAWMDQDAEGRLRRNAAGDAARPQRQLRTQDRRQGPDALHRFRRQDTFDVRAQPVTSAPSGTNCGLACPTQTAPFPATPPVQLTAAAAAGSVFTGWSGDCAGTAVTTAISVTSNKNCTATFDLTMLTVIKAGCFVPFAAAPSLGAVRVSPMTAVIGTPTQITVKASITDGVA